MPKYPVIHNIVYLSVEHHLLAMTHSGTYSVHVEKPCAGPEQCHIVLHSTGERTVHVHNSLHTRCTVLVVLHILHTYSAVHVPVHVYGHCTMLTSDCSSSTCPQMHPSDETSPHMSSKCHLQPFQPLPPATPHTHKHNLVYVALKTCSFFD